MFSGRSLNIIKNAEIIPKNIIVICSICVLLTALVPPDAVYMMTRMPIINIVRLMGHPKIAEIINAGAKFVNPAGRHG